MSRQRDYQPTIDRARNQAEIAQRREAKLREKRDECHREMLRAQAAARIAGEEANALRDRIIALEQSVRDLRRDNASLRSQRDDVTIIVASLRKTIDDAQLSPLQKARDWFRDMLRIGVEA